MKSILTRKLNGLLLGLTIGVITVGLIGQAFADPVYWASDWTVETPDHFATCTVEQDGIVVDVSYAGHLVEVAWPPHWVEGDPPPYTGNPVVDNAPAWGIMLVMANTDAPEYANMLTFSSPLIDPLIALYSVGRPNLAVPYEFDQPFTLLSEGAGFGGNGYFEIDGNTLTGYEGHGVIQFYGAISAIGWNNPVTENHHGFAFGVLGESVVGTESNTWSGVKALYR